MTSWKRPCWRCLASSASELLVVGTTSLHLQSTAGLLLVDAADLRTLRGLGGPPRRPGREGGGELLAELIERRCAVLTLGTISTRARSHHRTECRNDSLLVLLAQGARVPHPKGGDDASQGAVGVLSPGSPRRRDAKFDLLRGNRQPGADRDRAVVVGPRTARHVLATTRQSHHGELGGGRYQLTVVVKKFAALIDEAVGHTYHPLAGAQPLAPRHATNI